MEPSDLLSPELYDAERQLLRWGIIEWERPGAGTDEMAVAIGFKSSRASEIRLTPLIGSRVRSSRACQ